MKKYKAWTIVSYLVALGYLFLGYFFYEWSFHMVPYSGSAFNRNMALDAFIDGALMLIGILFLIATFLLHQKKPYAVNFYRTVFWAGLAIPIIGGMLVSVIFFRDVFATTYFQTAGLLLILYLPAIFLYAFRNRFPTQSSP